MDKTESFSLIGIEPCGYVVDPVSVEAGAGNAVPKLQMGIESRCGRGSRT